eukprot:TRINITY_DN2628_c0_g1_i4.p1 TRINITY_DN2628_c0_g1~~TRINITY_DN2628_c0_g1_i4.p1  ORF type:complete len:104 (+),score=4.03 TRINITY_DN2628_c0_g1_i4:694-1005(+)
MTQTPQLESCAIRLDNTSITDIAVTKLLDTLSLLPLLQRLYLTLGGCSVTNTTGDKLAALLKYKETLIDFDVSLEWTLIKDKCINKIGDMQTVRKFKNFSVYS